jgi:hypothetical protein
MRIYDGSPRQDFEEVLRSIGASLDQRGAKDVLVLEVPDGFIVQAVVHSGSPSGAWSESLGQEEKETMTFTDDEIAKAMDDAIARRGHEAEADLPGAGTHEHAFRIIGRYIDEQNPRDIFFFEQEGAFVVRLHHTTQTGSRHTLAEFTRDDVAAFAERAPALHAPAREAGPQGADKA